MTESELNWQVLRDIIAKDAAHTQQMHDSDEWTALTKAKLLGRIEAYRRVLESMCTLEFSAELTLSFPIDALITSAALAEHTATAPDPAEYEQMGDENTIWTDGTVGPKPNYLKPKPFAQALCEHTATACDTITKAATA